MSANILVTPDPAALTLEGFAPTVTASEIVSSQATRRVIIRAPRVRRRARIRFVIRRFVAVVHGYARRHARVDASVGQLADSVTGHARRNAQIAETASVAIAVRAAAIYAPTITESVYTRASVTALRYDREESEELALLGIDWTDDEEALLVGIGER